MSNELRSHKVAVFRDRTGMLVPTDGFIVIERFRSMEDFLGFWDSPDYRKAVELRAGEAELDVVVALEAVE